MNSSLNTPRDDHYDRIINLPATLKTILLVLMYSGAFSLLVVVSSNGNQKAGSALLMLTGVSALLYRLNQRGNHRVASFGAFLLTAGVLVYIQITNNGLYDISLLAYPAVLVFSSLLLGTNFVMPITLIMAGAASVIQNLTLKGFITPYNGALITTKQDYWSIITAIIVTGILVYVIMSLIEQNVSRIIDSEERLKLVYESTLKGWARALEMRDHETEGHSQRVTQLTINLAKELGIKDEALTAIRWGALLHDIGKMSVPDAILLKKEKLSEAEYQVIKEHPHTAYTLLENIPYLESATEIPHAHHERWDGSGYPHGLKGEDIPLSARIFSVVDVWDALRSDRPYKSAWSAQKTMNYLEENAGTLFDPNVVQAFKKMLTENNFPDKTI